MKILFKWFLSAFALMSLSYIDAGIAINGFQSALFATLVIGCLNLIVRPILVVLTLPVTLITLGLFLFVINAFLFWMASAMLEGFQVQTFGHALFGSLIYSLFNIFIDSALERLFSTQSQ
ncbi:MAG: phage holin family protein [Betaproteobacteria bacterium]|jgi:putative membrane protein